MKHLPKHLRPRWRYLAVELEGWPDAEFSRGGFQRALWYAAGNLLGDPGSADADLRVFAFAFADGAGEAIVRARRGHVSEARAALACVSAVDGDAVRVAVRGVSGTVRAAEENYLGRASLSTGEEEVVFRNATRRAVARDGRIDIDVEGAYVGATRSDLD
ncbi:Rpp14/Pop5 family protein [Salarchaeum sp. JOR-1]|uniref:Rpp14/Pop5 family protein n=1 Tax=Salarchaeum sp. JOR-1 TaxID=2599399 RepID=UPI001198447D|nr:Rpp14/Pop5 family protein [Salarchaeum sp. JOR-1]QDX41593.1 ribonuclease P [Salarchaeum sp. JOR-1]